jgi:hypothetical protein
VTRRLKKYTDEQLSRILSEAAAGHLSAAPGCNAEWCCIEMAAFALVDPFAGMGGGCRWQYSSQWDDAAGYAVNPYSPPDVLRWLESRGWA